MTSVSACHILLTLTQPGGSRRPERRSNQRPPDQKSHALPAEPLHPLNTLKMTLYPMESTSAAIGFSKGINLLSLTTCSHS